MSDKEKVIKDLEKIADEANPWKESPPLRCDLPYPLLLDALELLKEQEDALEQMRLDNTDLRNCNAELLKEQEAVEPFHKCIGKDFSLIEDSHFDYCPYCGKPITWAKQEGR